MVDGFSKYSRFLYSRIMPSFSTIRLNRFNAFSNGSSSFTFTKAITHHPLSTMGNDNSSSQILFFLSSGLIQSIVLSCKSSFSCPSSHFCTLGGIHGFPLQLESNQHSTFVSPFFLTLPVFSYPAQLIVLKLDFGNSCGETEKHNQLDRRHQNRFQLG